MNLAKKINSERLTEKEYRKLPVLSYSACKKYDQDREAFFKEFILGEKPKEKKSNAIILGDIVHTLLSGIEGAFDDKFHIASAKKPSGQMGDLCDALFSRSLQSMNEYNEQQDSIKIIFSDSVQKVKYDYEGNEIAFKKKDEAKILEMFEGSDAEMWYREALENKDKTIVSIPQIEQAERLVQKVKESNVTSKYTNEPEGNVEVFSELPIEFTINDVNYKCLPDRMFVNHDNLTVTPIDWKTSWDNEAPEYTYIKYSYYLQAALYNEGIGEWAKKNGLQNYKIQSMKFVFIDVTGFNSPCILNLSDDDIDRANRGFKIRGIKYKGLKELQQDLAWHNETGIWHCSRELYKNNGQIKLNLAYGSR